MKFDPKSTSNVDMGVTWKTSDRSLFNYKKIKRKNKHLELYHFNNIIIIFVGTSTEYSSTPISSKFSLTTSSRFSLPSRSNERIATAISYSGSDRYRTSSGNSSKEFSASSKAKVEGCSKGDVKSEEDLQDETCSRNWKDCETDNRLEELESSCVSMISRGTSPTPPASSSFMRNRRADMGTIVQKERARCRRKVEKKNQEVQCDRNDEPPRFSRFGGSSRVPGGGWSSYLDKFSSASSTSSGNPTVYSSRNFNPATAGSGTSGNCTRIGGFAFSRANENSTTSRNDHAPKVSSTCSQELDNNHHNREQNREAVTKHDVLAFSRNNNETSLQTANVENVSRVSPSFNEEVDIVVRDQKDENKFIDRDQIGERKDEDAKADRLPSPRTTFHSIDVPDNPRVKRSADYSKNSRASSTSKSEEIEEKSPSLQRLNGGAAFHKSDRKLSRTPSKTECSKPIQAVPRERRDSTPKSENSLSLRNTDSSKLFDAHPQEQKHEAQSSKKESLSRYLSTWKKSQTVFLIFRYLYPLKSM